LILTFGQIIAVFHILKEFFPKSTLRNNFFEIAGSLITKF
jgi:hypothetical protein